MAVPKYDRDFLVSSGFNSVVRSTVTKTPTESVIFQVLGVANSKREFHKQWRVNSTRSFIIRKKRV